MINATDITENFSVYDYVPVGICLIDKNYTVLCWNKCLWGWTGINPSDILGRNLLVLYPNLSEPVYKLRIDLMFRGHAPTIFSSLLHKYFFPVKNSRAGYQIQSATLTSIPNKAENDFFALIAIEDHTNLTEKAINYRTLKNEAMIEIQKRKEAEEKLLIYSNELEELNATKDKFFSIIAHDLKSPFFGFIGLTNMMADNIQNFTLQELQEISENLKNSANNLFRLLENLLEWSKMQRGLTEFNPENCKLSYILKQNIEIISETAKQKEITIINRLFDNCEVYADVPMLNTIVRNLISNAVKFTPRGGWIEIGINTNPSEKLTISANYIEIYVRDNGIGMDNNTLSKLFRIDEKISRPGTEGESSTGLGLMLCKEFIEKHGGSIRVESKSGEGSTFYFMLPQAVNN